MTTFYDNWCTLWETAEQERRSARQVIHSDELEWVETPQDAKVALLVAPETGFRTWGSVTMMAEIPAGWHTGSHQHGEEALHIVDGHGFSVIGDHVYPWAPGSTMVIPFGVAHQHFNTGDATATYISALSVHLEHFVGLHRTTQHSTAGPTESLPDLPQSKDGYSEEGTRVVLDFADRIIIRREEKPKDEPAADTASNGAADGGKIDELWRAHHLERSRFMSVSKPVNDLPAQEQEISGIISDGPHSAGGKHAHMEAIIHILDGTGYSIIDDEKVKWRKGSTLHIQGPQTVHQHFNDGDEPSKMLRMSSGIRYFFERIAYREFPYLYFRDGVTYPRP